MQSNASPGGRVTDGVGVIVDVSDGVGVSVRVGVSEGEKVAAGAGVTEGGGEGIAVGRADSV